ncbi:sulfatase [Persicirhabdus sediminis]|uniref:Sulfatase n=1 Tax=Persicirhabdus sediminis TaxID=454144 RepID=A0A8J7SM02_9BACT|nr:sulfatase [Persicirhabdus sediminis]MBK1791740.1 sulfatase [Persicirhabdus sediminis]
MSKFGIKHWAKMLKLTAGILLCSAASIAAEEKKNVLMVVIDDLMPALGCYGDELAKTPHIDQLAQESTVFERAYCQYPICNASRTSLMSGLRPDSSGVYGNNQPAHNELTDTLVMNKYFMQQGFDVIGIGKIYHASEGPNDGWSKPYFKTKWLDHIRPENKKLAATFFNPKKSQGLPPSIELEDVADDAYCDGQAADAAVKEILARSGSDKPFFMALGFRHPHLPWCAPKKYWDMYDRDALPLADNNYYPKDAPQIALKKSVGELGGYSDIPEKHPLTEAQMRQSIHGYLACVSYVDAQLGKVVSALKEAGLYDNTVIVIWGDHGYQLGNHNTWAKGVNWESSNHAPLILRTAGQKKAVRVNGLVEFLDVYPSLCEASGIKTPAHCEGSSLVPLVKDPSLPARKFAFSQLKKGPVMGRSIRSDRYRFTIWEKDKNKEIVGIELYDLQEDPAGNQNLSTDPEYEKMVEQMTAEHRKVWPAK